MDGIETDGLEAERPLWGDSAQKVLEIEIRTLRDAGKQVFRYPDEWFTVITPLHGSCEIEGEDEHGRRSVVLVPGEISKIAPGKAVTARTSHQRSPAEVACIRVSAAVVAEAMDAPGELDSLNALRVCDPHIASMAPTLMRALVPADGDGYVISAARYLGVLLARPFSGMPAQSTGLSRDQIKAVTQYMHKFLGEEITLDDLSRQALLSRYHFIRRFTETTGKTPFRYLMDLRINAARYRLTRGDEPVSQVGRRCGFPSAANFARAFRRHVGCSPLQYRQRTAPRAARTVTAGAATGPQ